MKSSPIPQVRDAYAYRTYLIKRNPFYDLWYVSKDGHHITSAETQELAKLEIDKVVDGVVGEE